MAVVALFAVLDVTLVFKVARFNDRSLYYTLTIMFLGGI